MKKHLQAANVGIIDLQIYFPSYYVDQNELEAFDKVDKGKYTIGLGQEKLAFVGDREDVNSISLTVLDMLMKRNKITPKEVGRLEVGTETFIDKSKSIKTYLMHFFREENTDIEGVTNSNACYGGTNALINAINWLHSDFYDGRYAIVICADIAVYSKSRARPSGGCGAMALLLGENANIVFENIRASYMNHVYDFYKPNPSSEYPIVDGGFSVDCYFKALEACYELYVKKQKEMNSTEVNLNYFDYFCFHSPYSKLVEKGFFQLVSYDMKLNEVNLHPIGENDYYKNSDIVKDLQSQMKNHGKFFKLDFHLFGNVKKSFIDIFKSKVFPGLLIGKNIGNTYCGSLYVVLLSLILNKSIDLTNKRLFLFSYGSGCAATIYSLKILSKDYQKIIYSNRDVLPKLERRIKIHPEIFDKILLHKEQLYLSNNFTPSGSVDDLFDGTYYLEKVDELWRRYYSRKGGYDGERKIHFNILSNTSESTPDSDKKITKSKTPRIELLKNQFIENSEKTSSTVGLPAKIKMADNIWSGFHRKSVYERQLQIKKVYPKVDIDKLKAGGLTLLRADNMIENCIGVLSIPIGLGLNFKINSRTFSVPMAVEEPSIVAGVSAIAKLISDNDGFFCYSDPPLMTTQIHFTDVDTNNIERIVKEQKDNIISLGNSFCQTMVQRGGGLQDIFTRTLKPSRDGLCNGSIAIEIVVNVCDSMGANLLNTIAEEVGFFLESHINSQALLKILSNLSVLRKTTAEFKINLSNMNYKTLTGEELAERIMKAQEIALMDPFRAATHNKGIMNGIDAVAVALGQDWRAIEAGVHAYASLNPKTYESDKYKPLTYYKILEIKEEKFLYGNLTIPLAIGVVGGAINSNDNYLNLLTMIGNPNAQQLAHIMTAVGLAQNFAAIRALVSEGIQRGHMGLQARNVALRAGVPDYLIPDVVNFMKNNKSIHDKSAKKYLESLKLYHELRAKTLKDSTYMVDTKQLSSFYLEIDYPFLKEPILMNFLLKTKIEPPIHFWLYSRNIRTDDVRVNEIYKKLFGPDKQVKWLLEFIKFVSDFDLGNHTQQDNLPEYYSVKYKLKMLIILLYVISINLLIFKFEETRTFLNLLLSKEISYDDMLNKVPNNFIPLEFGSGVLLELYEIMKFYIGNYVKGNKIISQYIQNEVDTSLKGFISMVDICKKFKAGDINLNETTFDEFFEFRLKRLNANVMILCDLAFSEENISENMIKCFLAFGRYVEIKITLLRDYYKSKETENQFINSYVLFEELLKKDDTPPMVIKAKYFQLKQKEREQLKAQIAELVTIHEGFTVIVDNLEKSLEKYYSQDSHDSPIAKF